MTTTLRYIYTDTGYCRAYYRVGAGNGVLYCWQDEGKGNFILYRCTESDHEPEYAVNIEGRDIKFYPPQGGTDLDKDLTAFLETQGIMAGLGEKSPLIQEGEAA